VRRHDAALNGENEMKEVKLEPRKLANLAHLAKKALLFFQAHH
jgi:hypothetical protein